MWSGRRAALAPRLAGKCSLWVIGSGYLLGIGELWFVRAEAILHSAHFYFATIALGPSSAGGRYMALPCCAALHRMQSGVTCMVSSYPWPSSLMVGVGLLGLKLLP